MMDFVEEEKREVLETIRKLADVAANSAFINGHSLFGKGLGACHPKGSHLTFHVEVQIEDKRPISHRRFCGCEAM